MLLSLSLALIYGVNMPEYGHGLNSPIPLDIENARYNRNSVAVGLFIIQLLNVSSSSLNTYCSGSFLPVRTGDRSAQSSCLMFTNFSVQYCCTDMPVFPNPTSCLSL
ncbi:hypothetical protein V8F33_006187, partial [Rhypophila sp. PSN 637]